MLSNWLSFNLVALAGSILLENVVCKAQECPSFSSLNSMVYFTSEERANASIAEQNCIANAGKLANIRNEKMLNVIADLLNKTISADLLTLYEYTGTRSTYLSNSRYSTNPNLQDDNWKLSGYNFTLYNKTFANYDSPLYLCYHTKLGIGKYKWDILKFECTNRWLTEKTLYGGKRSGPGIKTIYGRRNEAYSIKLEDYAFNSTVFHRKEEKFYVPDVKVFIGARSDVNQTDWFWSDGTMVNDSSYPNSSKEICQQMSLHYQNAKWSLAVQLCNEPSFYVCEAELPQNLTPHSVDDKAFLNISWNPLLFRNVIPRNSNLSFKIEPQNIELTSSITVGRVTIDSMMEADNYTIQINVTNQLCPSLNLSVAVNVIRDHVSSTAVATTDSSTHFLPQTDQPVNTTTQQTVGGVTDNPNEPIAAVLRRALITCAQNWIIGRFKSYQLNCTENILSDQEMLYTCKVVTRFNVFGTDEIYTFGIEWTYNNYPGYNPYLHCIVPFVVDMQ